MLLTSTMMQAARLDRFERGDVFDRIAQLRPALADADLENADRLAVSLHPLFATPVRADSTIFASQTPLACAQPWFAAFSKAGDELSQASAAATLQRGLRAVLSHLLIFHWNRLGLPATTQSILARAATLAILPRT